MQKFVLNMLIRFVMSCTQVSVYTDPINFLKVSATPEKQVLWSGISFGRREGGGDVKVELGEGAEKSSVVDYALLNKDYMVKKDIARKKRLVIADYPYLYPDSISFNDISGKDCLK